MTQYIAIPAEENQGCEGCCFLKEGGYVIPFMCKRPDSVPHCQQTDEQGNVKEFIYEAKP